MTNAAVLAAMAFAFLPGASMAEVADSSAGGFTVKITVQIQAVPDDVYRKLVRNVGDWWNSAHTYSQNAHNLSIEDKPAGCFCEKLPNQGGVRHMEVLTVMPGKMLVLAGALGPLQSLAVTGSMTFKFAAAEGGTKLELTYAVAGYLPAGMNTWAAPVDSMLREQVTRLKNYVEGGDPARPDKTSP